MPFYCFLHSKRHLSQLGLYFKCVKMPVRIYQFTVITISISNASKDLYKCINLLWSQSLFQMRQKTCLNISIYQNCNLHFKWVKRAWANRQVCPPQTEPEKKKPPLLLTRAASSYLLTRAASSYLFKNDAFEREIAILANWYIWTDLLTHLGWRLRSQ